MANLKEIRTRISSVKSTRQITSAMKMVSAAKLRRAQDAIIQMRPYADKLFEILGNLSKSLSSDTDNIYGQVRPAEKILLVAITSNKGLCGAFNANVVKKIKELTQTEYKSQYSSGNLDIITIGKKGFDGLKGGLYNITGKYDEIFDQLTFENALGLVDPIMKSFVEMNYDRIILVYNQFKNAAVQILVDEQFLPIINVAADEDPFETHLEYIFEPSKEKIVEDLIPKSLKIQFFRALLDSHASEHGARMTAMHKATDNATDLIKELQLEYNKARQSAITNEILEIVGGAEALKG